MKVTGWAGSYGAGQSRVESASVTRRSISAQASVWESVRAEKRPSPVFTGAVTSLGPSSSVTSLQVALSPATNTIGTPNVPQTAASMPLSPTSSR